MIPSSNEVSTEQLSLLTRYEQIIEISQQLTSTLNTQTLLRRIVQSAASVTDSEAASILLVDAATGELRFEMASNMQTQDFERFVVPLEGSVAGWVVSNGQPLVVNDVRQEPRFFKDLDSQTEFQTRNLIAVPLRSHRGDVIGCLEALNRRQGSSYQTDDVKLLSMLSLHAGIAIENARLFLQSDFIAEAMHELRNPLASLRTSAALLRRPNLPPEKRTEIVELLDSEIQRLAQLASEYLDLARLESGRTQLNIVDTPLHSVINECIDIVRPYGEERGIRIQWSAQNTMVRADRGKIKQVILNLLSNAVKYNKDNGQIQIELATIDHDGGPFSQVAVADTGYGISKENQRFMFQKFYRAADTSSFTQGTGLGLAIARHIIEAHGGSIWLESELDQGSTFFFTLPKSAS